MKTKLSALALGLCILLVSGMSLFPKASADQAVTYNAEQTYERAGSSVLYIRALNEDGSLIASGTGVIISPEGVAATACHVISAANRLEAILADGLTVTPIESIGCDTQTDAGLVKLPLHEASADSVEAQEAYPFLQVRETPVKHGEKVFAIGYPMKDTPIITEGIINSPNAEINGRSRILTSSQIVSGMSGGPIIDMFGRLAGITSGSLKTMNNIHLVIPMDELQRLLPSP